MFARRHHHRHYQYHYHQQYRYVVVVNLGRNFITITIVVSVILIIIVIVVILIMIIIPIGLIIVPIGFTTPVFPLRGPFGARHPPTPATPTMEMMTGFLREGNPKEARLKAVHRPSAPCTRALPLRHWNTAIPT